MLRKEAFKVLEFDKVLELVAGRTHSEVSQKAVLAIQPFSRRQEIEERLGGVQEARRMASEGAPLPITRFGDLSGSIARVRPEGAVLEPVELYAFVPVMRIIGEVISRLEGRLDLPRLRKLTEGLTGFPGLLQSIERSVDGEGNVLDTASYALADLRVRIRGLDGKIRKRLEELTRSRQLTPFLQDEFVTKRSGRWVIPVRMDAKGQVRGVVHDVSRSGETAFVEPLEGDMPGDKGPGRGDRGPVRGGGLARSAPVHRGPCRRARDAAPGNNRLLPDKARGGEASPPHAFQEGRRGPP
jgi:DNA mismatch repair protein MutS2